MYRQEQKEAGIQSRITSFKLQNTINIFSHLTLFCLLSALVIKSTKQNMVSPELFICSKTSLTSMKLLFLEYKPHYFRTIALGYCTL